MDKTTRIRQIIEDLRSRPEPLTEERIQQLIVAHSDLMPELEIELRSLTAYQPAEPVNPPQEKIPDFDWGDLRLGDPIGPYKVLERLGRGGMGVVYLVEQKEPIYRKVALKMMQGTMVGKQVLSRFEAERQALALMDHPSIATIHEADTTAQGRPYFLMEHVKGDPITTYCDHNRLNVRARLELFMEICKGIFHAHQKGIVHRDIKPSNVLVMMQDGKPVPKIIDFGLAKSLIQKLTDETYHTEHGQTVGTYEYMSPEQVRMTAQEVDTRTDIFSLGALLYQLLVGVLPFGSRREGVADYEIKRRILHVDPEKLSDCIKNRRHSPKEKGDKIAANRSTEPRLLEKQLREDLDWIVLKALQKDQTKRYQAVTELAEDIQRHLNHEPVRATKEHPKFYKARKFFARHKAAVLSGIAFGLVVMASVVTVVCLALSHSAALAKERDHTAEERDRATQERDRATRERDRASELLKLARKAVNDYTTRLSQDPRIRSRDLEDLRKELLATGVGYCEAIARLSGDDPEVRAELVKVYGLLAEITADIGPKSDAIKLYDKALAAFEGLAHDFPDAPDYRRLLATTLNKQATLFRRTDRLDRVEAAYQRAIDLWRKVAAGPGATPRDRQSVAGVCGNMGNFMREIGRPDAADGYYRESRKILEDLTAQYPSKAEFTHDLAAMYRHIGVELVHTGRVKEAEERMTLARNLGEALVRAYPKNEEYKVHLGATLNNLAILYTDIGRPGDAEKAYQRAVELGDEFVAAHPRLLAYRLDLSKALNNLGTLYGELVRYEQAEKALLRARGIRLGLVEADPADTAFQHELAASFNNLGLLYKRQGLDQKAEAAYREASRIRDRLARTDSPLPERQLSRAVALNNRANLFDQTKRSAQAEKDWTEALDILRRLVKGFPDYPPYAQELSRVLVGLGGLATNRGDWDSCLRWYGEALDLRQKLAADHPTVTEYQHLLTPVHNNLGRAYHFMKRYGDAEKEYREAIRIDRDLARRHPKFVTYRHALVMHLNNRATAYGVAGELAKAEETFKAAREEATALERDFKSLPDQRALRAAILNGLGVVYMRTRRRSLGEQAYREGIAIMEKLHEEFPQNAEFAAGLGLKYGNMGEMTEDPTQPETALDWYAKSIEKLDATLTAQPHNRNAREYLAQSYRKRAEFLGDLKRHTDARRDWEAAVATAAPASKWRFQLGLAVCLGRLKDHCGATTLATELVRRTDLSGGNRCDLAVTYSLSSAAAAADEELTERKMLAEQYAARAVQLLAQAHEQGFFRNNPKVAARLQADPAFASLRGRPDFQRVLRAVEKRNAQPSGKAPKEPLTK